MSFSIAAALDRYIAAQSEPRLPDGKWHPSGLFGCARKAVYEIRGIPPSNPPDARQQRVFFIGHRTHQLLQEVVAADPAVLRYIPETGVDDEALNITGHADGLRFMADGSVELDEFKTISSKGLAYARKKGDLPKEDHKDQAFTYAVVLRRYGRPELGIEPLGDRLKRVRFFYLSKEDYDAEEIVVDLPGDAYLKVSERVVALDAYAHDAESLPARLPKTGSKKNWRCDWGRGRCPFYDRCWNQDPDEVQPQESIW